MLCNILSFPFNILLRILRTDLNISLITQVAKSWYMELHFSLQSYANPLAQNLALEFFLTAQPVVLKDSVLSISSLVKWVTDSSAFLEFWLPMLIRDIIVTY